MFTDDLPYTLPSKIRIIWKSCFRRKDFLEIVQSQARIACGGDIFKCSGRNKQSL
jgi:hypothetical protein